MYRNKTPEEDVKTCPPCSGLSSWFFRHGTSSVTPELERQVNDRISFRHFLGYPEKAPDYSMVWQFREHLAKTGKDTLVWEELQRQLDSKGLRVLKGGTGCVIHHIGSK